MVLVTAIAHKGSGETLRPLAALVVSGLVIGAVNVRWLLFGGGVHAWSLQTAYGKDLWYLRYPFEYLVGSAPFESLYHAGGFYPEALYKPLFWNATWTSVSEWVAVLALLLVLAGAVALTLRRQSQGLACLLTPLVYGIGVFLETNGGFGGFQSVLYLTPIACTLAAYGVFGLSVAWRRPPVHSASSVERVRLLPIGSMVLALAVAAVLIFQLGATVETDSFFVEQPGMMPTTSLQLRALSSVVPDGVSVLMYPSDGSDDAMTFRNTTALTAAAYFLPNRNITIEGKYFSGTYAPSEGATISKLIADKYRYILHVDVPGISVPRVPSTYRVVWRFRPYGLVLYRRD